MSNTIAYRDLPPPVAALLRREERRPATCVHSGKIQSVIHFFGVKLGGVNRLPSVGHAYIATGVVLTATHEKRLEALGFTGMVKPTASGHEHRWWQIPLARIDAFAEALAEVRARVALAVLGTADPFGDA